MTKIAKTFREPDLDGTDVTAPIPADFRLTSGETLEQTDVIARIYGPEDAPLVIAAGGISSGRFLYAKEDVSKGAPGWWEGVAGPDHALDLNRWRVLTVEFAPRAPSGRIYTITTQDQARLIHLLVQKLGNPPIHALVGASYGAMIGLAYASLYPDTVARLCLISAAHRAHPMATAMRGLQRRILKFGLDTGHPENGISLARQLAMTTYRSENEFAARFDRSLPDAAGDLYPVCEYLTARGDAYAACSNRWISLSDSLDRHRVDPADIRAKVVLAAVPTDRLVPFADMEALHRALGPLSRLIPLPSLYGHDAFLKEIEPVSEIIRTALED